MNPNFHRQIEFLQFFWNIFFAARVFGKIFIFVKGQLISKGLFDVIVSTKKTTHFVKRSDQNIKALHITN